jgi:hypothetical protein
MKKVIIVLTVFIVLITIAWLYKFNYLSNKPWYDVDGNKIHTISSETQAKKIAWADRDTLGCIGSAGYTWSTLLGECIRIFEVWSQYEAYGNNTDTTLAAYVIEHPEGKKVEVFLPSATGSVTLDAKEILEWDFTLILFENTQENIKIIRSKDENYISQNGELVFVATKDRNINPSESYSAEIRWKNVVFSVFLTKDGLSTFELREWETIVTGNLNYERGLWADENATVYVLNFDKPESEQKKFVKLSAQDGIVSALNRGTIDPTYQLFSK